MTDNINTKGYWETRFSSGDWEASGGRDNTEILARGFIPYFGMKPEFEGTILDFGCGLGDAMPVYKEHYPHAKLVGMDISESAVEQANNKYASIATFMQGDYTGVPDVDIIIASHVLEHLSNDREIVASLLVKCSELYVFVPYKESHLHREHVNTYTEDYYSGIGEYENAIFPTRGWSRYGWDLWYHVYIKNIFRFLMGRKMLVRNLQIMFHFTRGDSSFHSE